MGHTRSAHTPSILFRRRRERENSLTPGLTPTRTPTTNRNNNGENSDGVGAGVGGMMRTPSVSTGSLQRDEDQMLMEDPETTFVWGTNVNIAEAQSRFRRFIANFQGMQARAVVRDFVEEDDLGQSPKYPDLILDVIKRGENSIDLDCGDLYSYDEELYSQLISYPQEIVPLFDIVMNDIAMGIVQQDESLRQQYFSPESVESSMARLQVRTFNLREVKTMRGLDPSDVDHLISVKGMVTHVSSILPDLKQACFKCSVCGNTPEPVYIDRGNIQEPQKCNVCNSLNSFILLHNRCLFSNKQQVKMQETPDTVPEGETPSTMATYVFDDHVDAIKPGDRVKVTGIFRALPVRVASKQRNLRSVFKTYVDVIHVEKDDPNDSASFLQSKIRREAIGGNDSEAGDDDSSINYTAQEEQAFKEIAQGPDIYSRLVKSLAPSIWELDDVKRGILCQLFSGTRKGLQTGERLRSEVNVLLCGDPGTSKSQLMSYVHKLSPRGIYTSGRGSSSVGLTAYVARDPETRELVLESGALVLSDLGVCCIDEFDKMSDDARNALHEAMEQQTVSLAKAGIICTLNARTSVLASANPAGSRYNPAQSVVENLKLPSTLLSRFDLIFLILDKPDLAADRQLARHLVSLHNPVEEQTISPSGDIISLDMLRAYILYAQSKCKPVITDDAAEALVNYYVDMRRMGTTAAGNKVITSTPRQLESLVRLSEALAKMKLSSTVEVSDVDEAARLVKVALQQSATDPRTGTIDMDLIQTGVSSSLRQMRHKLEQDISETLSKASGRSLSSSNLLQELKETLQSSAPSINELWEVLQQMSDSGRLNIRGDQLALA